MNRLLDHAILYIFVQQRSYQIKLMIIISIEAFTAVKFENQIKSTHHAGDMTITLKLMNHKIKQ